uniref:Long-chain fatty acid--CoA ligase n=1 Tax=candidate division WOR-3 bacterium TaxID=2052148 RepID=A0A7C2K382_UNCW3
MESWRLIGKYTIPELVKKTVELHASRPAMGFYYEEPFTYGELMRRIISLSHQLREYGVRKGSKVAILGENSPNWVIAYLSTVFLGGIAVPILPDFHPSDISNILRHSESIGLFASKVNLLRLKGYDLGEVRFLIALDDFTPETVDIEISPISSIFEKARNLALQVAEKVGLISDEIEPDDVAAMIYTSGTTGNSKGVMLTHKNIVSNVSQVARIFDLNQDDRVLSILPLAHSYEFTLGLLYSLSVGACIYYIGKKPTPALVHEACQKVKPTIIPAVPLLLEKVYKSKVKKFLEEKKGIKTVTKIPFVKDFIYSKIRKSLLEFFGGELRCITLGGAPLSLEVEKFLKQINFPYAVGYGLTEASPLVSGSLPTETRLGSAGKVAPDIEVRIVDPDPRTGVGEIWLRGPNIMKGYYKNENLTREVLTEDGWLKTGDLGYVDKDNYIYIKGRSKNMILTAAGENIYPENIEEKLNMHPLVQESVVYEREGKIVAKVYLNYDELVKELEGKSDSEREKIVKEILRKIRDEVNEQLPSYSRLSELYEYPEPFEKTPTNKIKRYLYVD